MIHLSSLAKSHAVPGSRPKIVLRPTTLALPADRRLAVLGEGREANSAFLRLLAGVARPTRGTVISDLRLSPVVRRVGLFHPHLNSLENIRFFARMLNFDADQLMLAVGAFAGAGSSLGRPPKDEDGAERKAAEMALLTILPFDCYLIDEITQFSEAVIRRHLDVVAPRGAGMIFSTTSARLARQFGDCAIVIRNGIVHPFSNVAEALAFDGR